MTPAPAAGRRTPRRAQTSGDVCRDRRFAADAQHPPTPNAIHGYGALFWAGVFGVVANSWWMFAVALAAILALHVHAGHIRLARRPRF